MKTVTIEIPDDSELIKEGNIYKIYQVIPKTWEEFCNRTPIRREYFIGYDSKINLRENKGRAFCGWPIDDYHSRIKAFDKLISEYRLNK